MQPLQNNLMITPEQIQEFINWQQEKPESRKVDIRIGEPGYTKVLNQVSGKMEYPGYNVSVVDRLPTIVVQIVCDVSEIDLVGIRRRELKRQIEELEKLNGEDVGHDSITN